MRRTKSCPALLCDEVFGFEDKQYWDTWQQQSYFNTLSLEWIQVACLDFSFGTGLPLEVEFPQVCLTFFSGLPVS